MTPIALPVDAAISYYESSALPWERAAFIRARAGGGRCRRSAAISSRRSIRSSGGARSISARSARSASITRRIRDHYAQGQAFGPGYDLKRGRGGIREVEFFAQIHQLIHGGREPELRAPATLDALAALAEAGRIDGRRRGGAGARPIALLRTIEHRLQMVDDRQTHSLPADAEALDNVARLHGLADGAALLDSAAPACRAGRRDLRHARRRPRATRLPDERRALERALAEAGFAEPAAARARIEGWRSGKVRSLRTNAAREAFEAMLPVLIDALRRRARSDAGAEPLRRSDR